MLRLPARVSYYNPVIERMSRQDFLQFQWKRLKDFVESSEMDR